MDIDKKYTAKQEKIVSNMSVTKMLATTTAKTITCDLSPRCNYGHVVTASSLHQNVNSHSQGRCCN